jgi:hypothetical protein
LPDAQSETSNDLFTFEQSPYSYRLCAGNLNANFGKSIVTQYQYYNIVASTIEMLPEDAIWRQSENPSYLITRKTI